MLSDEDVNRLRLSRKNVPPRRACVSASAIRGRVRWRSPLGDEGAAASCSDSPPPGEPLAPASAVRMLREAGREEVLVAVEEELGSGS